MSFSAQRSLEHFREFSVKLRRFRKVIGNPRRRWDVFENRAIMASWLVVNLPGMSLLQITEDFFSDNTHHVRFPLRPFTDLLYIHGYHPTLYTVKPLV